MSCSGDAEQMFKCGWCCLRICGSCKHALSDVDGDLIKVVEDSRKRRNVGEIKQVGRRRADTDNMEIQIGFRVPAMDREIAVGGPPVPLKDATSLDQGATVPSKGLYRMGSGQEFRQGQPSRGPLRMGSKQDLYQDPPSRGPSRMSSRQDFSSGQPLCSPSGIISRQDPTPQVSYRDPSPASFNQPFPQPSRINPRQPLATGKRAPSSVSPTKPERPAGLPRGLSLDDEPEDKPVRGLAFEDPMGLVGVPTMRLSSDKSDVTSPELPARGKSGKGVGLADLVPGKPRLKAGVGFPMGMDAGKKGLRGKMRMF